MTASKTLWTVVRVIIGVALVVWLTRTGVIDWGALSAMLKAWPVVAAAQVLLVAALSVTALRLVVILKPAGLSLTIADAMRLTMIGTFFSLALPGGSGGDIVKIWLASQGNSGRRTEVAAGLVIDRIVGLAALLLWPLVALPFFSSVRSVPAVQALAAASGAGLVAIVLTFTIGASDRLRASAPIQWLFARAPLGRVAERLAETLSQYRRHLPLLGMALLISVGAHTLTIAATLLVARAVLPAFDWSMAVVVPLGFLANALPLTPGGLGVGEAAFNSLVRLTGSEGGASVLIGWRVMQFLPAGIGLVLYFLGQRRFVTPVATADASGQTLATHTPINAEARGPRRQA